MPALTRTSRLLRLRLPRPGLLPFPWAPPGSLTRWRQSGHRLVGVAAGSTGRSIGGDHRARHRESAYSHSGQSLNPVSRAQFARLAEAFPDVVVLSGRAEQVAETFADLVEREEWDVLGLIGGDGARAALGRLDASAIRIVDTMLEGIPLGIVLGGRANGMPVFTKAGGFGAEDALVRVVERIRA